MLIFRQKSCTPDGKLNNRYYHSDQDKVMTRKLCVQSNFASAESLVESEQVYSRKLISQATATKKKFFDLSICK